ncbi:MerR family transcriptional regulator [Zunongwangia sp.]|uniref:MerR family transcriptional regulator n=1 Tax=Zunongwangia sp. TaxID=1965325 RepID=UPI003AA9A40E
MESVKRNFSIKDLENLSGIKAHTIRIWEKRYNIFTPNRTSKNIRFYDSTTLQKILNISLLNENGYKISRISKLNDTEINKLVYNISSKTGAQTRIINSFKLAMIRFNEEDFEDVYQEILKEKEFEEIFTQYFIPLLQEVGILWQTDTLQPIHEHFLVNIIKEKIYTNNALVKQSQKKEQKKHTFILFLPENEIHDLSLLFLQHTLLKKGFRVIFLGQNLTIRDLKLTLKQYPKAQFVTFCTIEPQNIGNFVNEFQQLININSNTLHILGHKAPQFLEYTVIPSIKVHQNLDEFISNLP